MKVQKLVLGTLSIILLCILVGIGYIWQKIVFTDASPVPANIEAEYAEPLRALSGF